MADELNDIQPAMRRTVEWLRSLGWETTDSGDGVTNVEAGMGCALSFPHVFMRCGLDPVEIEAQSLMAQAESVGLEVDGESITIEAHYSPVDDVATLMLSGVTDDVLAAAQSAKEPQP